MRWRRARRKQQAWAKWVEGNRSDTDQLLAWFFGERLSWPDDLTSFLRERAWTDIRRVTAVAEREAARDDGTGITATQDTP